MPVNLSELFSKQAEWVEMAEHTNRLLREYGYYNYEIVIRHATKAELQDLEPEYKECSCVTAFFDASECRLELLLSDFGLVTEMHPFNDQTPKEFAEINVIDTLDQFINGSDPLDSTNHTLGRRLRVIEGGKKS